MSLWAQQLMRSRDAALLAAFTCGSLLLVAILSLTVFAKVEEVSRPDLIEPTLSERLRPLIATDKSKSGKPYRFAACTITRNEMFLSEWIIRNALTGFQHFIIFDDNQLEENDIDITPIVQPFVDIGLVTVVTSKTQGKPQGLSIAENDCASRKIADWMIMLHTDEILHILINGADIHTLGQFIEQHENKTWANTGRLICGIWMNWHFVFSNDTINHFETLLEYKKISHAAGCGKTMWKSDEIVNISTHVIECRNFSGYSQSSCSTTLSNAGVIVAPSDLQLMHFWSKSVEEYIIKMEQPWPDYQRVLSSFYQGTPKKDPNLFVDTSLSIEMVEQTHYYLCILPINSVKVSSKKKLSILKPNFVEFSLYMFMKWKVTQHERWNNLAYETLVPEAKNRSVYVSGLDHFLQKGFFEGSPSCWTTNEGIHYCHVY